jgi:ABC-type molybdate transport system permease subunit
MVPAADHAPIDQQAILLKTGQNNPAAKAFLAFLKGPVAAAILVFAHTVGEFGVVLMIGGGIPGKTEVISVRIYQLVESLRYGEAHALAAGVVVFSFAALLALLLLDRRAEEQGR